MTYSEATEYLFCQRPNYEKHGKNGYKIGLDSMLALDKHVGHPHRHFQSIHVAGTNGKGSVSHTLAAILQQYGYKVGLYTSPHLVDFCERIKINGQPIGHDYVISFVEQHRHFFEPLGATFFEVTTAMAFQYFSEQGVDIVVVEVGLGGRLDSTNIISPILSVITNISLDHTQQLGNTVERIAHEKAGIMKRGVPCVVGEATPEVRAVFDAEAQQAGATIIYAEDQPMIASAEARQQGGIHYQTTTGAEFDGELSGNFQSKNTNTILCAIEQLRRLHWLGGSQQPGNNMLLLHEKISEAFAHVAETTGLQGRWQTVRRNPTVVCDSGHNQGAWQYLGQQLAETECHEMHIIFGMLQDKDFSHVMEKLPRRARYYWTKGDTPRALPTEKLQAIGKELGLKGDCFPTVAEAYKTVITAAREDDFIYVGGSMYVVSEFLKLSI